jgi:hypothetical protein
MMQRERKSFDPACLELAELFLADVPNATEQQASELASMFQLMAEGFCGALETPEELNGR